MDRNTQLGYLIEIVEIRVKGIMAAIRLLGGLDFDGRCPRRNFIEANKGKKLPDSKH